MGANEQGDNYNCLVQEAERADSMRRWEEEQENGGRSDRTEEPETPSWSPDTPLKAVLFIIALTLLFTFFLQLPNLLLLL